jgi:hypothetical protein
MIRLFDELDATPWDPALFPINEGRYGEGDSRCHGCGIQTPWPGLHVNPDTGNYECEEP